MQQTIQIFANTNFTFSSKTLLSFPFLDFFL